jgi:hypothetical protein
MEIYEGEVIQEQYFRTLLNRIILKEKSFIPRRTIEQLINFHIGEYISPKWIPELGRYERSIKSQIY